MEIPDSAHDSRNERKPGGGMGGELEGRWLQLEAFKLESNWTLSRIPVCAIQTNLSHVYHANGHHA